MRKAPHCKRMKWLTFAVLLALTACARVEDVFVVRDDQKLVEEATLDLCGVEITLARLGEQFVGRKAIDCEGSGQVKLRYTTGKKHECIVGYVTPGAGQHFSFRATKKGCQ